MDDQSGPTEHVAACASTDLMRELAIDLDGELSNDEVESEQCYRAALQLDRVTLGPTLSRLRRLHSEDIRVVASSFDPIARLLAILGIPSVRRNDGDTLDGNPLIVFLGCGAAEACIASIVSEARFRHTILVTSDRVATHHDLSEMLRPRPQSARRTARARWNRVGQRSGVMDEDDLALPLNPVSLGPGHVPIAPEIRRFADSCVPDSRVLVSDGLNGDPLVVLMREDSRQTLHAVPHWFQTDPIVDTAVDRRPIGAVPAFRPLGELYPEVTLGRLSAARLMLSAFIVGLGMAMSHRSASG